MDLCRSCRQPSVGCAVCLCLVFSAPKGNGHPTPLLGIVLVEKKEFLSQITLVAIEASLLAGELLRQGFGSQFSISNKEGRHNLVTEYDHKAEKEIIRFIKNEIKNSCFLAEESGHSGNQGEQILWIIDPLDGTVNFAHQIPFFAVSIAAVFDDKIQSGIIYQPITDELFVAEKGKGAFLYRTRPKTGNLDRRQAPGIDDPRELLCRSKSKFFTESGINGQKLSVSKVKEIASSMLSTGFPYDLEINPFHCIEHFVDLLKLGLPIRRFGSAALDLAYTAAGRFEGFFEVELAPWDVAAGQLIVEEAGGRVSRWNGEPFDIYSRETIVATNGLIHDQIVKILNRSV